MAEMIFFLIVPRTWPASEFHPTRSPTLESCFIGMISDDCFVVSGSGSNHRENHLEPLQRLERVRLTGGHENHLAALQAMRLASDADFRLAFEHLHSPRGINAP